MKARLDTHRVALLTEADLDRHEAERLPVPAMRPPIKSVEAEHPWLWLLYAAGAVASCAASALAPTPWFGG